MWMFSQIIESTGIHPGVILTDADPAVDLAIRQVFPSTYPIHCAYHITNTQDYMEFLYKSKTY